MNAILSEERTKLAAHAACPEEMQEMAQRFEKGVQDVKAAVTAKYEDGKFAAERLLKRGRFAVEDGVEEAAHAVKRNPFGALAVAFTAGAVLGFLVPRAVKR